MHLAVIFSLFASYFGTQTPSQTVFVFDCMNTSDNVKFMMESSLLGVRLSIVQLNDRNTSLNIDHIIKTMLFTTHNISPVGIIFNYDCPHSKSFISASSSARWFAERSKWLIFEENIDSLAIQQLRVASLFIDAEIAYINFADAIESANHSLKKYAIYDIYNNAYSHGGRLNVTFDRYFMYDVENGGHLTESRISQQSKYSNRRNLSDITIRLGLILPAPKSLNDTRAELSYLLSDNDTTIDTQSRHGANVISVVAEMLGCNVSYTHYDIWTTNDSYGGAIQATYEDEIDLPLGLFLLTLERFPYMSIVSQVSQFRSFFFFRTSRDIDLFGNDMLKPFASNIWYCLISTILLASVTMTIIFRWEHRLKRSQTVSMHSDSTMVTAFAVYCQQGSDRPPTLSSGRCLFIFLFLSSIMIYNYYTSVLVSGLVGSSSQTNIKNVYNLADCKLKVGFDNVPYIKGFLNSTTEPEFRYFIDKKLNISGKVDIASHLFNTSDGFGLVQRGGFAFHCEASTAYPVIGKNFQSKEICDVNQVPFRKNRYQGIIVRKGSPFLKMLSTRFYWMRETGALSKHERHWVTEKPLCLSNAIVTSVGFDYTAPLFFFLVVSYIAVLIILIFENIFHYFQQERHGRCH